MLSIIIPWYNRIELKNTFPPLIHYSSKIGGDVTLVNFGGDECLLNEQLSGIRNKISVVHVRNVLGFNKPIAQNIGAYCSKQPYLFFCDCDILFTNPSLLMLLDKVQQQSNAFGTLSMVKESKLNAREAGNLIMFGYILKLKISDGTEAMIVDNEEDATEGTRQAPGLLLVRRNDFENINGYNSELDGWGWEDQDMVCRLTLNTKLKRIAFGNAIHISHTDKERMQGYHNYTNRWQSRDRMFRHALDNYNKGILIGTYTADISKCLENIEIN